MLYSHSMNDCNEMKQTLDDLIESSKLTMIFKPGKLHIQDAKLPHTVSYRLKLHNPYTFLEFYLADKKTGLKFGIKHLKTMPKELRSFLLSLGGAPDNSGTFFEFPCDSKGSVLLKTLTAISKELLTPAMIKICGAEDYKPVKIILTQDN